jgi:hypothetical protein
VPRVSIYLDANILWPWRTFDEIDRLALSIVASQIGQRIFVPEVAAKEAAAHYRRSLEEALGEYESALQSLRKKFGDEFAEHEQLGPGVEQAVEAWESRLRDLAEILPTRPEDALEGLHREISGTPPAKKRVPKKPGAGARDVAIWLTILGHHRRANEPSVFITKNKDDFASGGALKPELAGELADLEHPITLFLSLEDFIATLGTAVDSAPPSLDELQRLAEEPLRQAVRARPDIPPAYWGRLEPHLRYESELVSARPVNILAARRYEQGDDAVTLIDSEWTLDIRPLYREIDTTEPGVWSALVEPVDVDARVHLFVRESKAKPEAVESSPAGGRREPACT